MPKQKVEQVRRRTISDPFAAALLPPPNETPTERENRLKAEQDARKVSEHIDELLRAEKKQRPQVKVLLLGQSESGKSTTLKRECRALPSSPVWQRDLGHCVASVCFSPVSPARRTHLTH